MPKDSSGKFHPNIQKAMHADKGMGKGAPKVESEHESAMDGEHEDGGEGHMQVHDHGDGSFHTMSKDGEQTEHPHIGHMLMHIAAHHAPDAKHIHHMHDGMEHVTHHVAEDGNVEGPHSHPDIEAAKEHMGQVMGDGGGAMPEQEMGAHMGGMRGY
jgi:hypothetical protein